MGKDLNMWFTKKVISLANKHMKMFSISLVIREKQIKIIMRYNSTPTGMVNIQKTVNLNVAKDANKLERLSIVGRVLLGEFFIT